MIQVGSYSVQPVYTSLEKKVSSKMRFSDNVNFFRIKLIWDKTDCEELQQDLIILNDWKMKLQIKFGVMDLTKNPNILFRKRCSLCYCCHSKKPRQCNKFFLENVSFSEQE